MKDLELNEYKFYQEELDLLIHISSQTLKQILKLAFPCDNCENGGFLIGRYAEGNSAIIEDIVSSHSKSTPMSFIRYTDGMQYYWDKLYDSTGQIYLGEWHSHPNSSAKYSNIDRKTMIEISEANDVKIMYPIFLIVGFSKQNPEIKCYTVKNKTIFTYEQR